MVSEVGSSRLRFLIVGTPRSGTTLVQRLASEVMGVRVPPETHFFTTFASPLLRRRAFPLDPVALRAELELFARSEPAEGLDIDVDAIVGRLGGRCRSAIDLFEAIVLHLAGDDAPVVGEKTPDHVLWWRPLTLARPDLKIVAVVRDPRATVASNLEAPWAADSSITSWGSFRHVALAERWRFQQGVVKSMMQKLPGDRFLFLRYEDIVSDPTRARDDISALLKMPDSTAGPNEGTIGGPLFLPNERWRRGAVGPIVTERVEAWRAGDSLSSQEAIEVAAICRRGMRAFGYIAPGALPALASSIRVDQHVLRRRAGVRRSYRRKLAVIERLRL